VEQEERALEAAILSSRDAATAMELAVDYVAEVAADGDRGLRGAGANALLHAWASADRDARLRETLLRRRAQASALARAVIEGAISRGELGADLDVEALSVAVTSFLDGLFLQRAERGAAFTVDDARRQALAFVDAILRPVRETRAGRPTIDRS
jgi:hypothetical protein